MPSSTAHNLRSTFRESDQTAAEPDLAEQRGPAAVVLQEPPRAIGTVIVSALEAAAIPVPVVRVDVKHLAPLTARLRSGRCLPVGTPEFMRECVRIAGREAHWDPYPRILAPHLLHQPRLLTARRAVTWTRPVFLKPAEGKPFRGFVARAARAEMTPDEDLQMSRLVGLEATTPVWVAGAMNIHSIWRYYVLDGGVAGFAPLEMPPAGENLQPALEDVSAVVAAMPTGMPYALDFAVHRDGCTSLLCVRDPLFVDLIPFGPDRPAPLSYLLMVWKRWWSLTREPGVTAAEGECSA